jgi:ELWxxDGT repeat protein
VRDIAAGYDESIPRELAAAGGKLWLSARTSTTGHEPWISDGTGAGTRRVADLRPGAGSSTPADFAAATNGTVFSADAGGRGRELWRSDGTAAGTSLLQDVAPGVRGADIAWIHRAGDRIFLSADDGAHGQELWSLPATLPPPADTTAPVVSSVAEWLQTGSALTADGVPVALTWRATDDRAAPADLRFGISSRRMSGGTWGAWGSPIASAGPPLLRGRVFGNRTQARVRATDPAGNTGAYATGPAILPVRVEDSAGDPPLRYAGAWTRVARSGASGGTVRATSAAGATATLSFKARSVGVVMPRRAGLGTASVCLDPGTSGQSCTTVDLSPAIGLGEKRVVWMRNGLDPATTRKVQVRAVSGTVELDAFVELRP